jgi:hypothetical protein
MKRQSDDPIVTEVRRARHEISAEHGHDTGRLGAHYMKMQEAMKKSGKYQFVTGFFATSDKKKKTALAHR